MARGTRRVVRNSGNDAAANIGVDGTAIGDGNADGSGDNGTGDGTVIIDPADIGGPDGSDNGSAASDTGSPGTRRRGRKPGSASQKKVALDVSGVEQLLFSVHMMLAGITRTPELALAPLEAKTMAEAMGKVSRHYDVTVGAKAMDWANMAMVAGMVYGPRLIAMRQRGKNGGPAPQVAQPQHSPAPPRGSGSARVNIPGIGEVDVSEVG